MPWKNTPTWKWKESPEEVLELLRDLHPVTSREQGFRALLAILTLVTGEEPTLEGVDRWFEALQRRYPDTLENDELSVDDFISQALFARDTMPLGAEKEAEAAEELQLLRRRHAEVLRKTLHENGTSVEEVSRKLGYEEERISFELDNSEHLTYQTIFEVLAAVGVDIPGYFEEVTRAEDSDEVN